MTSLSAAFDALRINTLVLNIRLIWCQVFPTKHVYEEAGLFSLSLFST